MSVSEEHAGDEDHLGNAHKFCIHSFPTCGRRFAPWQATFHRFRVHVCVTLVLQLALEGILHMLRRLPANHSFEGPKQ